MSGAGVATETNLVAMVTALEAMTQPGQTLRFADPSAPAAVHALVAEFGSPLLILDLAVVRQQYAALSAALPGVTSEDRPDHHHSDDRDDGDERNVRPGVGTKGKGWEKSHDSPPSRITRPRGRSHVAKFVDAVERGHFVALQFAETAFG